MNYLRLTIFISALLLYCASAATAQVYFSAPDAATALKNTQNTRKYLFVLVNDKLSDDLVSMERNIKSFQNEHRAKFNLYKVNLHSAKEASFINRYGLFQAPMPVLLIISPEGVITGGYPKTVNSEQMKQSINWPALTLKVMKSLQERKITLVCLQNTRTKYNAESDRAVKEFMATPGYQLTVDVIKADPAQPDSADFLKQVGITDTAEAKVVFLMPPGRIVKVHSGKITKADLEASMQSHAPDGSCCPAPGPAQKQ